MSMDKHECARLTARLCHDHGCNTMMMMQDGTHIEIAVWGTQFVSREDILKVIDAQEFDVDAAQVHQKGDTVLIDLKGKVQP